MATAVPQRIGKYAVSGVLGRGAMGIVYKGFDPHIQRQVAIKTIHRELLGEADVHASIAARFRNEAQAVGRLQHTGIVAIYEFGEDETTAYIAMEFVEGKSLDQLLANTPLLPDAQVTSLVEQLLDALDCAHRHGVWHRDIKPANLLLTVAGQLKLTDFGIARIENAGLTVVASAIGTPGYMSPEQYIGEEIDHRADLFAVGVLLYRLLTGVLPFTGTPETVMYKILHEHPRPPSQVRPGALSDACDGMVMRALAKRADDRFQSAPAFRQAVVAAAGHHRSAGAVALGDATVIVPPGHWARLVVTPASTPSTGVPMVGATPLSATSMSGAKPPEGWSTEALGRIERLLAPHVGPMARLLVNKAARQWLDVVNLTLALSPQVTGDAQRQRFIADALAGSDATRIDGGVARSGSSTGTSATPPGQPGTTPGAGDLLTDEVKAHALAVLTRHIGPIAKFVMKRAVEKATGKSQFHSLLVAVACEADPVKLLKDLQAP